MHWVIDWQHKPERTKKDIFLSFKEPVSKRLFEAKVLAKAMSCFIAKSNLHVQGTGFQHKF